MFALASYGFHFGIGPTIHLVIHYYDRLLTVVFGWMEPLITAGLLWVHSLFPLSLVLQPHWKHIFVLMCIYFLREAGVTYRAGYKRAGIALIVWGLTAALLTSICAGVIPLSQADFRAYFLVAAIPLIGFLVYDLCDLAADVLWFPDSPLQSTPLSRRAYFGSRLRYILVRPLVGLVVIVAGLQVSPIRQSSSPSLILLALLVCVIASFWLWRGASLVRTTRETGEAWHRAYLRTGATQLGLDMLGVFFWLGIALAANAGLGLYGL